MRVLLADPMPLFSRALAFLLEAQADCEVVGTLRNLDNIVAQCNTYNPDIVVIRTFMFFHNNAFTATKLIKEALPDLKVVIIIDNNKSALVEASKDCLADSCVSATAEPHEILNCINETFAGQHIFPFIDDNKWGPWKARLTDREMDTIRLICLNLTYEEMAVELKVSKRTVSFHVSNILGKTGHKNITGLILEAGHKGYVTAWKN